MAKRDATRARARLDSTIGALQLRMHPKTLANEAWDGVRDKGTDLADGALDAVKKRPAVVSAALGAFVLFLARDPLRRVVTRMFSDGPDESVVTTRIDNQDLNFEVAAPLVSSK